jgi:type IV secretion system pilin
MHRITAIIITLLLGVVGFGVVYSGSVAAAPLPVSVVASSRGDACAGLGQLGAGATCDAGAQSEIGKVITAIVKIVSVLLGAAGVIMIVIAGFKYITSNGDAGAVGSAKRTLIYALVGLAVAALAQFLVDFVFNSFKS